jgi:hypothetical protein
MVIYEVYLRSNGEKGELISILPERRVDKDRIHSDSVMKWSRIVFGDAVDAQQVLFIQKTI